MEKVKQILLMLTLIILLGVMVFVAVSSSKIRTEKVCKEVVLESHNPSHTPFLTKQLVINALKSSKLYPVGKKTSSVNLAKIEKEVAKFNIVSRVECFNTVEGNIKIEVIERTPLFRVMPQNGKNFYVDNKGEVLEDKFDFVMFMPIVTGHVSKTFATERLIDFMRDIVNDEFWSNQIEQIDVSPKENISLVTRVGQQIVDMGSIDGYERKLKRLKRFYEEAFNEIGWNKYKQISLKFDNQIICTK